MMLPKPSTPRPAGLKPAEKYPKDQLVAITKKREELAKKAEEERLGQGT